MESHLLSPHQTPLQYIVFLKVYVFLTLDLALEIYWMTLEDICFSIASPSTLNNCAYMLKVVVVKQTLTS